VKLLAIIASSCVPLEPVDVVPAPAAAVGVVVVGRMLAMCAGP
jgi:hypothetical protein